MSGWSKLGAIARGACSNPLSKGIGGMALHPQRTLRGAGSAVGTAAVGAGTGYVAWEALVNDKPIVRAIADVAIGEENVDKVMDKASGVAEAAGNMAKGAAGAVSSVAQSASSAGSALGGVADFLKNVTGGGGMDMFGSFFSNLAKGNVSGMGILGLIGAGLLIFGRFGWLGKIGGALLAMMLIGNNSKVAQAPALAQEEAKPQSMQR